MENVFISSSIIQLCQLLKWIGIADTGGQSKIIIDQGRVKVNSEIVKEYRKKVISGDLVSVDKKIYRIIHDEEK